MAIQQSTDGLRYVYGQKKPCKQCGKEFQARDADSANYTSKYCSGGCRNKARAKHRPRGCAWCGTSFKPIRKENRFCSKVCSGACRSARHVPSESSESNKRMAVFCCSLIHRCMRNKSDKTKRMLGYTVKELRQHLEARFEDGMSWSNYGKGAGQWSIDHIKPISAFHKAAPLKEINALSNLRPMWHYQNCSKGNKWEGH